MIIWVRGVLRRTAVGDWRFDKEVISRVKCIVFVRRRCYKSVPLKLIGQFSHDGISWKFLRIPKFKYEDIRMARDIFMLGDWL